jgi:hypothetical protein
LSSNPSTTKKKKKKEEEEEEEEEVYILRLTLVISATQEVIDGLGQPRQKTLGRSHLNQKIWVWWYECGSSGRIPAL